MKAESALVGAYGAVELDAVAEVDLYLALVVDPGDAEDDDALGLDEAFDEAGFFKFGMLVVDVLYGHEYFVYGLEVFLLSGVSGLETAHYFVDLHIGIDFLVCYYIQI